MKPFKWRRWEWSQNRRDDRATTTPAQPCLPLHLDDEVNIHDLYMKMFSPNVSFASDESIYDVIYIIMQN